MKNIIQTNTYYNSKLLELNISELKKEYPFLETGAIGKSVMGTKIPYIKLGTGPNQVFYNASIHANEWITSLVLMKFIEEFSWSYVNDKNIFGYSSRKIFSDSSIYIVPMCNPDGVDLVTGYIEPGTPFYNNAKLLSEKFPSLPFPDGWKSNIRGTDLNLQFPARLGRCKKNKIFPRVHISRSTRLRWLSPFVGT